MRVIVIITFFALLLLSEKHARAVPLLPYTFRNNDYTGYSTTVQGDLRTLGMAGAVSGLADTYLAATSNPAGTAMTLPSVALQFSSNASRDGEIQDYTQTIRTYNSGFAMRPYPWGFSMGLNTPHHENQEVALPTIAGVPGRNINTEVRVREANFSLARLFFDDQLSLGVTTSFIQGNRVFDGANYESRAFRLRGGAMYQFPDRWLLGITYAPRNTIDPAGAVAANPGVPGVNRAIRQPEEVGLGLGWIPNRIFRAGLTFQWVGTNPTTALLSDDSALVGIRTVIQPRLGLNYTAIEYKDFKIFVMGGSYYETSRSLRGRSRIHGTAGIDTNFWLLNMGWAIDHAHYYSNYVVSIGIDLIRTMKKLKLVPNGYQPELHRSFPNPFKGSTDDLPKPLVRDYVEQGQTPDLIQIGTDLPGRAMETLNSIPTQIQEGFNTFFGDDESESNQDNTDYRKYYPNRPTQ